MTCGKDYQEQSPAVTTAQEPAMDETAHAQVQQSAVKEDHASWA